MYLSTEKIPCETRRELISCWYTIQVDKSVRTSTREHYFPPMMKHERDVPTKKPWCCHPTTNGDGPRVLGAAQDSGSVVVCPHTANHQWSTWKSTSRRTPYNIAPKQTDTLIIWPLKSFVVSSARFPDLIDSTKSSHHRQWIENYSSENRIAILSSLLFDHFTMQIAQVRKLWYEWN